MPVALVLRPRRHGRHARGRPGNGHLRQYDPPAGLAPATPRLKRSASRSLSTTVPTARRRPRWGSEAALAVLELIDDVLDRRRTGSLQRLGRRCQVGGAGHERRRDDALREAALPRCCAGTCLPATTRARPSTSATSAPEYAALYHPLGHRLPPGRRQPGERSCPRRTWQASGPAPTARAGSSRRPRTEPACRARPRDPAQQGTTGTAEPRGRQSPGFSPGRDSWSGAPAPSPTTPERKYLSIRRYFNYRKNSLTR